MPGPIEVERKYALAAGQELPSLTEVVSAGPVREFDLVATYYDSPDLRLNQARVTLRRRTGGHDDGWHLKSPGSGPDERFEDSLPISALAPRVPPSPFRDRVEDVLSGAPLIPVATLRTHRREQDLLDDGGTVVALLCTDHVTSLVAGRREEWWEAEVELAAGDPSVLDQLEAVLTRAGIQRAAVGSKLARALAETLAVQRPVGADSSAGDLVGDYLARQVGVLQRFADALRSGTDPEAVHDARVATRRLRSTLRTFGAVFHPVELAAVVRRLRRFTRVLAPARDGEVVFEHLLADATEVAGGEGVGVLWWVMPLESEVSTQYERLEDYIESPAYQRLQASLSDLLVSNRRTTAGAAPALEVLPGLRATMIAGVAEQAARAPDNQGDLVFWHNLRKGAKVVRYATELMLPVLPGLAGQRAAWEHVTESLGVVHDLVVAHGKLSELTLRAIAMGGSTGVFDPLRRRLEDRLRPALEQGQQAVAIALAGE